MRPKFLQLFIMAAIGAAPLASKAYKKYQTEKAEEEAKRRKLEEELLRTAATLQDMHAHRLDPERFSDDDLAMLLVAKRRAVTERAAERKRECEAEEAVKMFIYSVPPKV